MTSDSPKITVLIGTYNRPGYLKEAIASVVNQTMDDWELLVMNDGGVDVGYVVDSFGDPRITYFNDDVNRGFTVRLNFGLKKARGKYIAYLGDDDLYYPHHLEVLSKALDEHPEIGAAYSDLYAVSFIKDEITGKRYPLKKYVQVSRDFNRDFMLYFNHTLHVSLMHKRDLALRVEGYNEKVGVLIDWNMTRKLCYYTDFLFVPQVTGEYYMPIFKSDRISVLERKDRESYKHNLRKIKADLPPEPWTYIHKVAIIVTVDDWDDELEQYLADLTDSTYYPYRLILVNNDPARNESSCREALGKINDLNNIQIVTVKRKCSELEAFRLGVESADVDYVYLLSREADLNLQMRVFATLYYHLNVPDCPAVKLREEQASPFDLMIKTKAFTQIYEALKNGKNFPLTLIPCTPPSGMIFDFFFKNALDEYEGKNYQKAYNFLRAAMSIKTGTPGEQYLNGLHSKVSLALKNYKEAEEKCRALIDKGYQAENWIRLGDIYQAQEKYSEAIAAYQEGLKQVGLRESDLASPVFPITHEADFDAFEALIGLGECLLKTGDFVRAAKTFRRASKTKLNSHRPLLGFVKMFLADGRIDQAKNALYKASQFDGQDPEINRLAGALCEKENRFDLAFDSYLSAFQKDKTDLQTVELIVDTGTRLGKWKDMKETLEEFLENQPASITAICRLAEICLRVGEDNRANELVRQGLTIDRYNDDLLNLSFRLRHADKSGPVSKPDPVLSY